REVSGSSWGSLEVCGFWEDFSIDGQRTRRSTDVGAIASRKVVFSTLIGCVSRAMSLQQRVTSELSLSSTMTAVLCSQYRSCTRLSHLARLLSSASKLPPSAGGPHPISNLHTNIYDAPPKSQPPTHPPNQSPTHPYSLHEFDLSVPDYEQ